MSLGYFFGRKKWNCDGPDGWNSYWRDLRKEPRIFSQRGFGGGSLMTWAAISSFDRLALVFIEGRMNSNTYLEMLESHLIPFLRKYRRLHFKFQQDNASIHVSSASKQWFIDKK